MQDHDTHPDRVNQQPTAPGQVDSVDHWLRSLQSTLCAAFENAEPSARFATDEWQRTEGGGGITRVLADGDVFERGAVNFSRIEGDELPAAATQKRPDLAGNGFVATGVSVVMHPRNPHVPTSHCNLRYFETGDHWWFGGGYDLTPFYPQIEDVIHWHRTAHDSCQAFGDDIYSRYKAWCDRYFYLPHRDEARGIGGLFFDDLNAGGFAHCFDFARTIGDSFARAYLPIVERRMNEPYGDRERAFQLYRRGRYVEFNLVHDRGTLFGLQSGGRTESILVSMPPLASWSYDWQPEPGSAEERLYRDFLPARDWLAACDENGHSDNPSGGRT